MYRIDQLIREGYRIYKLPSGYSFSRRVRKFFREIHGIEVMFDTQLQAVLVRDIYKLTDESKSTI